MNLLFPLAAGLVGRFYIDALYKLSESVRVKCYNKVVTEVANKI